MIRKRPHALRIIVFMVAVVLLGTVLGYMTAPDGNREERLQTERDRTIVAARHAPALSRGPDRDAAGTRSSVSAREREWGRHRSLAADCNRPSTLAFKGEHDFELGSTRSLGNLGVVPVFGAGRRLDGLKVSQILPERGAEVLECPFEVGDIIRRIDEKTITSQRQLAEAIGSMHGRNYVLVDVSRSEDIVRMALLR